MLHRDQVSQGKYQYPGNQNNRKPPSGNNNSVRASKGGNSSSRGNGKVANNGKSAKYADTASLPHSGGGSYPRAIAMQAVHAVTKQPMYVAVETSGPGVSQSSRPASSSTRNKHRSNITTMETMVGRNSAGRGTPTPSMGRGTPNPGNRSHIMAVKETGMTRKTGRSDPSHKGSTRQLRNQSSTSIKVY